VTFARTGIGSSSSVNEHCPLVKASASAIEDEAYEPAQEHRTEEDQADVDLKQ
jgi:hypothetical protein